MQEFLQELKQVGYLSVKIYAQELQVKFIQLCTVSQRRPFLLYISNEANFRSKDVDHLLEPTEDNYKSFRQREYLNKITLTNVVCLSKHNICLKNNNTIVCYLLDSIDLSADEDDSEEDSIDSDIVIDDYSVQTIYPVFHINEFIKDMSTFEETVLKNYELITEAEEQMNEEEVQILLQIFDKQKAELKEAIYQLHRDAYNTRRDISNSGEKLEKIYKLRDQAGNERDRTRFRVERLATDTERKIDVLNEHLCQQRNDADALLKRYRRHLEHFI